MLTQQVLVVIGARTVADSTTTILVVEPKVSAAVYLPRPDVMAGTLAWGTRASICEFKGLAMFMDVVLGGRRLRNAAWTYPRPTSDFDEIRGLVAFDLAAIDRLIVGGRQIPGSTMKIPG